MIVSPVEGTHAWVTVACKKRFRILYGNSVQYGREKRKQKVVVAAVIYTVTSKSSRIDVGTGGGAPGHVPPRFCNKQK